MQTSHAIKYPRVVSSKPLAGDFETTVCGIPCRIEITYYKKVAGDSSTWASDWDYYGYTEMEWEVLDRRGRAAPWLARKLTESERGRIEIEIDEHMGAE